MSGDWILDIDRVVLTGSATHALDANEIRSLVTRALTGSLSNVALPDGRTVRASVGIPPVPPPTTAQGIATAVASAVTSAVRKGSGHG